EAMTMWKMRFSEDAFKRLARLPKLKKLWLVNTTVEDDWIKDLIACKKLANLSLESEDHLTAQGVLNACDLKGLVELHLRKLHIHDTFVDPFLKASKKLKNLKNFWMITCPGVSEPARRKIEKELKARGVGVSIYDQKEEDRF